MPRKYEVALGVLYAVVFSLFAAMSIGGRLFQWGLAQFGAYPAVAGLALWALVLAGAIWLINKINRDWPNLSLPPEPAYSPVEVVHEAVLMKTQIDVRAAGSRSVQHPVENTHQSEMS